MTLLRGGDTTADPTLDLCNGTFPSERLRTARRQVVAVDRNTTMVLSTEAVLYGKPADTAQAFAELRALLKDCPDRLVPSPTGAAALRTKFGDAPDRSWPPFAKVERIAFDITTTDAAGMRSHTVAVYLRRGRVLLGLYFGTAKAVQPRIAGETTIESIARVFAAASPRCPLRSSTAERPSVQISRAIRTCTVSL